MISSFSKGVLVTCVWKSRGGGKQHSLLSPGPHSSSNGGERGGGGAGVSNDWCINFISHSAIVWNCT